MKTISLAVGVISSLHFSLNSCIASLMAQLPASSPSIPDLLQRYLNGETIRSLAAESKIARQTLYNWMLAECGPDYETMITKALVNRIAEADDQMENSADMMGFARGREMAKFARMDFERRRPKLYGPKQELQVDHTVNITVNRGPVILNPVPESDKDYSGVCRDVNKDDDKGIDSTVKP